MQVRSTCGGALGTESAATHQTLTGGLSSVLILSYLSIIVRYSKINVLHWHMSDDQVSLRHRTNPTQHPDPTPPSPPLCCTHAGRFRRPLATGESSSRGGAVPNPPPPLAQPHRTAPRPTAPHRPSPPRPPASPRSLPSTPPTRGARSFSRAARARGPQARLLETIVRPRYKSRRLLLLLFRLFRLFCLFCLHWAGHWALGTGHWAVLPHGVEDVPQALGRRLLGLRKVR